MSAKTPAEYARWCAENLPEGWSFCALYGDVNDGCWASFGPQDDPNSDIELFPHAALEEIERLRSAIEARDRELAVAMDALHEIKLGKGAYRRDPLQHADNCIDEMKALALAALAALEGRG